ALARAAQLIGRQSAETAAELLALIGSEAAKIPIRFADALAVLGRQIAIFLVALADHGALLVGQAPPTREAFLAEPSRARAHIKPTQSAARYLLLARGLEVAPALGLPREQFALCLAQIFPRDAVGLRDCAGQEHREPRERGYSSCAAHSASSLGSGSGFPSTSLPGSFSHSAAISHSSSSALPLSSYSLKTNPR